MRRTSIALAAVLVMAIVPSAGSAQVVPPGNSGVNQYTEAIPGAGGDLPSGGRPEGQGGGNDGGGSPLSPAAERALRAQGPIGAETAGLASATAPQRPARQGGSADGGGDSAGSGGSGFGRAVDHLVGGADSGGMGIALPIILASCLLGALLLFTLRRRGGAQPR